MYDGKTEFGRCPYACGNKTADGWCRTTACINPDHNGSGTFVIGKDGEIWGIGTGKTNWPGKLPNTRA